MPNSVAPEKQIGRKLADFDCRAGWLVDGRGQAVQRQVLLQVRQGRTASIQSFCDEAIDSRYPFFNYSDCTLIPPLVDAHVHLTMSASGDLDLRKRQLNFSFSEARPVIDRHLTNHQKWGVAAVRDGGDHHGHVLRYWKASQEPPDPSPVLRTSGKAWHQPNRYGGLIGQPVLSPEKLASEIRQAAQSGVHQIKLVQSGLNSLTCFGHQTPPQFSPAQLTRAIKIAHGAGLTVMVHANGEVPVRQALQAGCDSIEHGFFMGSRNLALMAERQTVWVPTAVTMLAYAEQLPPDLSQAGIARRTFEDQCAQIDVAQKLGVPMATGSDAGSLGVEHGRGVWQEMAIFMRAGLSVSEAIACATQTGARLVGPGLTYPLIPKQPAQFLVLEGATQKIGTAKNRIKARYLKGCLIGQGFFRVNLSFLVISGVLWCAGVYY